MTEETKTTPIQKFSWKTVGTFKTYEEAADKKLSLKDKHIKIRRCGPEGTLFSVKVGTAVKPQTQPQTEEE